MPEMSEQTPQPPREIDREDVLGELEHRFKEADPPHAIAWVLDELVELDILRYRTPPLCGADEGMSGISCQLPKGHIMPDGSLRTVHEGTTTPEQTKTAGYEIFVRWPVDGKTLPGTPSAPAKPERQVPLELRQKLADVLVSGDKDRAVRIALNWGMDYDDAVTYIEAMPEYQTGRNHRPVEDAALPPLHVDNEAIATGRYPEVSGAGVPHPPLDNEGIETGLYFAEKARRRAAGEVV